MDGVEDGVANFLIEKVVHMEQRRLGHTHQSEVKLLKKLDL